MWYTWFGVTGMFEGRLSDLHHASHPFLLPSLSFRTITLATAKGSIAPCPPSLPIQSGEEIQPSSRYASSGCDGMFEGRFPDLVHASHSRLLPSLSFRTIARASAKGSILVVPLASIFRTKGSMSLLCVTPPYPSQSDMEIQPSSRYIWCGEDGMFEGRCPALRHARHSFSLPSLSFRTIALASAKGSIRVNLPPSYPSQSGIEIQPSSRYVARGSAGMLEGRRPALSHTSHSLLLFSLSFRAIALAAAKGSMSLCRAWVDALSYPSQSE